MRKYFLIALCLFCCMSLAQAVEFVGERADFHGYEQYTFDMCARTCHVVLPKVVASGKPWLWRARFWGYEPKTGIALLEKGFHVAYCDVANLFGSPQAVKHWDAFYALLTEQHGFAKRPAIEAISRGGLIAFNWAAKNPEKVACIYADVPVCDFKSWPAGKGKGQYERAIWRRCRKAYQMSEEEKLAYKKNPIDNLAPLAQAGIPLLHVVGDADTIVPVDENTAVVEKRYKALGGEIRVIHKPGFDHQPTSLDDPKPIIDFIALHALKP